MPKNKEYIAVFSAEEIFNIKNFFYSDIRYEELFPDTTYKYYFSYDFLENNAKRDIAHERLGESNWREIRLWLLDYARLDKENGFLVEEKLVIYYDTD